MNERGMGETNKIYLFVYDANLPVPGGTLGPQPISLKTYSFSNRNLAISPFLMDDSPISIPGKAPPIIGIQRIIGTKTYDTWYSIDNRLKKSIHNIQTPSVRQHRIQNTL